VIGPDRCRWAPLHSTDDAIQTADVGLDQRLVEAGSAKGLSHRRRRSAASFQERLKRDMTENAAPQQAEPAEQGEALAGRDAIEAAAQPRLKRHTAIRLQHQGEEEELTELAIAGPCLTGVQRNERGR